MVTLMFEAPEFRRVCRACGRSNDVDAKRCDACGAVLAASAEQSSTRFVDDDPALRYLIRSIVPNWTDSCGWTRPNSHADSCVPMTSRARWAVWCSPASRRSWSSGWTIAMLNWLGRYWQIRNEKRLEEITTLPERRWTEFPKTF